MRRRLILHETGDFLALGYVIFILYSTICFWVEYACIIIIIIIIVIIIITIIIVKIMLMMIMIIIIMIIITLL